MTSDSSNEEQDISKFEINVFYSYAHTDEEFRVHLEEHLSIFRRSGLIKDWNDRMIQPGTEWHNEINRNLDSADLILLLVSSSFIASDYCYETELALAMSKHDAGTARVIPIFIRPSEWQETPFSRLQGLPKDARPVTLWENQDVAWQSIAAGLRSVLKEISEKKRRAPLTHMKTLQEALMENVNQVVAAYDQTATHNTQGMPSGINDLDRLTNGLHQGELLVIASRPGMGKTTLALNIANSVADLTLPILIFSTKLSAGDVSSRMLSSRAKINYHFMANGHLQNDDWPRLSAAITALSDTNVLIDDSPSLNLAGLREKCVGEKLKCGALGLVVIDSIQYIGNEDSPAEKLTNVGRFLKSLARELNTTVLVTSQVPRSVELRPNKRPLLFDMENPVGLVDEADVFLFVYVDSHYNPDSLENGTAELIVAKNQFGPIGAIRVSYRPTYGAFQNYCGEN